MKMRKSTWLLLVLALAAIFLVAGCAPNTPPTNGEEPNGEEPPTTPPTDKECPKPVSTVIGSTYEYDKNYNVTKLTITFNEPITSGCIEDPAKWEIVVKNSDRKDTELTKTDGGVTILGVDLSTDGKKAYVYAKVKESLSYTIKDIVYSYKTSATGDYVYTNGIVNGPFTVDKEFEGLICSKDNAKDYATPNKESIKTAIRGVITDATVPGRKLVDVLSYTVAFGPDTPEVADKVEWKLKNCVVADELGNACCDYSGSACCLEPTCATCEEGCILGSEGSCP